MITGQVVLSNVSNDNAKKPKTETGGTNQREKTSTFFSFNIGRMQILSWPENVIYE